MSRKKYDMPEGHEEEMKPKRRRKKGHKLYAFIVLILGLAIVAMTVLLLFYVQKIEVTGNEYSKDQEVVNTIQSDKFAVNSLYVLWKYHFTDYDIPESLEAMDVGLKNPWTIKVAVKERKILGFVYEGDDYVYFDKEGVVVLRSSEFIEGTPCIEGIDVSGAKLYQKLKSKDKNLFESILKVTQEVKKFGLAPDRIVCTDSGIDLYFGDIRAALGTRITSEKVGQLSPILEKISGKAGTLHLEHYQDESDTISFMEGEVPDENE